MRFFERGVQNGGGLWSHVQHRSFGLHESRRSVVAMKCPSTFFYDLVDNDTSKNLRILFIVTPASASAPGPATAHRWPAYRYSGPRFPPSLGHWRFGTLLINFKTLYGWMTWKGHRAFPSRAMSGHLHGPPGMHQGDFQISRSVDIAVTWRMLDPIASALVTEEHSTNNLFERWCGYGKSEL